MLTSFPQNPAKALEGQTMGERTESVPRMLPWLAQQTQIRIADSEAGDLVITVVDELTDQTYTLTVAVSSATEATSLDEMLAAWRAHGKLNALASVTEDGVDDLVITFRHANRGYTITTTPPGSMTAVVSELQAHGGDGVRFGRFYAKGANDNEFAVVGSSTTIADIVGALFRTDGNHFHKLENELPTDVDTLDRGKTHTLLKRGRMWMVAATAVTPSSTPYLRIESSDSDDLGTLGDEPVGSTQVLTVTPIVDQAIYGFEYGYLGRHYTVVYQPTDTTTSVADACAGLEDAAADGAPSGVTVSTGGTTAITLTAAAGTQFDYARNTHWDDDTEAATTTTSIAAADVDALDASSICEFETTAAAGELVLVRIKM